MENFIGTFVIILPGIMAYFWLQSFGINPPVKHTPPEVTGIAALLWLPISTVTLLVLNVASLIVGNYFCSFYIPRAWTILQIKGATEDIRYLILFMGASAVISYVVCSWWSRFGHPWMHKKINNVRIKRGMAPLSTTATVWEEYFIKIEDKKEQEQGKKMLLQIYKLDKPGDVVTGYMSKASRPHEADKAIVLGDVEEWQERCEHYDFPTKRVFYDFKNGVVIKELDYINYKEKKKDISPDEESPLGKE